MFVAYSVFHPLRPEVMVHEEQCFPLTALRVQTVRSCFSTLLMQHIMTLLLRCLRRLWKLIIHCITSVTNYRWYPMSIQGNRVVSWLEVQPWSFQLSTLRRCKRTLWLILVTFSLVPLRGKVKPRFHLFRRSPGDIVPLDPSELKAIVFLLCPFLSPSSVFFSPRNITCFTNMSLFQSPSTLLSPFQLTSQITNHPSLLRQWSHPRSQSPLQGRADRWASRRRGPRSPLRRRQTSSKCYYALDCQ